MTQPWSPTTRLGRREWLALGLLMVLVILVRVFDLTADPIASVDGGWFSDFGQWWKAARLHAMYGAWNLDEYNIGLWMAPGYTLALRGMFALFGMGFTQAFMLSAISGMATTLLVYAIARVEATPLQALLAAALFGINPLTIVNDRSGYAESFQLVFITLAIACLVVRPRSYTIAVIGGLAAAYAVAAKVSGVIVAPMLAASAAVWWLDRGGATGERIDARRLIVMAVIAAIGVAAFAVFFVLPNRLVIDRQFAVSSHGFYAPEGEWSRSDRVGLFGWTKLGFRPNGFFVMDGYLIALVAIYGAARIAKRLAASMSRIEVTCWVWLVVGGVYLSAFIYQPDRRFLFLVPPLAIIAGRALGSAQELVPSRWTNSRSRSIANGLAGALLGCVAGFYLVAPAAGRMQRLGHLLGQSWNYSQAGSAFLTLVMVAGLVAGVATAQRPARLAFPAARLAVIVAIIAAAVSGQWIVAITHRSHGMLEVSRVLDRISRDLPADQKVLVGWSSATYAMGTDLLGVNFENTGPSAVARYHPRIQVYSGSPVRPAVEAPIWVDWLPGREPKVACATIPLWLDGHGRPRNLITLMVDSGLVDTCKRAAREPSAARAH